MYGMQVTGGLVLLAVGDRWGIAAVVVLLAIAGYLWWYQKYLNEDPQAWLPGQTESIKIWIALGGLGLACIIGFFMLLRVMQQA